MNPVLSFYSLCGTLFFSKDTLFLVILLSPIMNELPQTDKRPIRAFNIG